MADKGFETYLDLPEYEEARQENDLERARREQLLADLRAVFGTASGRRVLELIVYDMCLVGRSIFTGNSKTFHLSGRQDVGNDIVDLVDDADPSIINTIRSEQSERNRKAREGNDA